MLRPPVRSRVGRLVLIVGLLIAGISIVEVSRAGAASPPNYWEPLGTTVLGSGPSSVSWGPGRIDVAALDSSERLIWRSFGDGAWTDWSIVDQTPLGSAPAISSWGVGRLDVFVRGVDGGLWHKWYDEGAGWFAGWESLGGQLQGVPAAASWEPGRIDVLVLGTDGWMWHKWYDDNGWFSGWEPLSWAPLTSPTVSAPAPGRLVIVFGLAGRPGSGPCIEPECRVVISIRYDRSYVDGWKQGQFGIESAWMPSEPMPTVTWDPGRADVALTGADQHVHHFWFVEHVGLGTEDLGGLSTTAPAMSSWGTGRLDIFVRGTDGNLWHTWYSGTWNG